MVLTEAKIKEALDGLSEYKIYGIETYYQPENEKDGEEILKIISEYLYDWDFEEKNFGKKAEIDDVSSTCIRILKNDKYPAKVEVDDKNIVIFEVSACIGSKFIDFTKEQVLDNVFIAITNDDHYRLFRYYDGYFEKDDKDPNRDYNIFSYKINSCMKALRFEYEIHDEKCERIHAEPI